MSKAKQLSKEEFRRMQLTQAEMLKEFDRVCRQNDISYVITDGTLLGAVRHKGYIPWDDDADISMLREEYEKFKKVSDKLNPEICYFQDHSNEKEYRWGYGKLRKTGTKFVRAGQEHLKARTGVFVDVFPMDDIPLSTVGQIWNNFYVFVLRKIMYSEVGRLSDSAGGFMRFIYKNLAKTDIEKVFKRLDRIAARSRNDTPNRVRLMTFPAIGVQYRKNPIKERYGIPKKWLLERAEYDFEGMKLYGTKDYDAFLTYEYGDYMTLPPVEEREAHAPVSEYYF